MERLSRTLSVFGLAAGLAACGAVATEPSVHNARFGAAETLAVGGTYVYDDGLTVTLARIDDSRCAPNVQCVWAGELAPLLRLSGGGLDSAKEAQLGTSRTARTAVGPYAVELRGATETTATFVITRGGGANPSPGTNAATGVRGTAHVGPTCAVETAKPDPACADRAYAGAFVVETVGGLRVADFTTGSDGRYSLALAPGSYQVKLGTANAMPSMASTPFTVRADGWTTLDLALDSGIR